MREETRTDLYIRNSNALSLAACKEIFNVQRDDNIAGGLGGGEPRNFNEVCVPFLNYVPLVTYAFFERVFLLFLLS
jgi:hypothetical protein